MYYKVAKMKKREEKKRNKRIKLNATSTQTPAKPVKPFFLTSMSSRDQKGICNQTNNHDQKSIDTQRQSEISEQAPPPISIQMRIARHIALHLAALELVFVIFVLDEPLMMR